ELFGYLETVPVGKADIEQHYRGVEPHRCLHRSGRVLALAHHLEPRTLEQQPGGVAEGGMIVDDQDRARAGALWHQSTTLRHGWKANSEPDSPGASRNVSPPWKTLQ